MVPRPPDQLLRVVLVKADAHLAAPVELGLVRARQLRISRLLLEDVVKYDVAHRKRAALLRAIISSVFRRPGPDESEKVA
jgi:hypothetical protein